MQAASFSYVPQNVFPLAPAGGHIPDGSVPSACPGASATSSDPTEAGSETEADRVDLRS